MALEKNWKRYRLHVEQRGRESENSDAGMFSSGSHAFLGCSSDPHTAALSHLLTALCFRLLGRQTAAQRQ